MTRRFRWVLVFLIAAGWMLLGGCAPKTYLNQIPPPPPSGHKEPATGSQQAPPMHNQPGTAPTDAPRSGAHTHPGPVEPPKPAPAQ